MSRAPVLRAASALMLGVTLGVPARAAAPKRDLAQALINAVQSRNLARTRALLAEGASPDSRDRNGSTPLMLVSFTQQDEIARLLLEKGASLDLQSRDGSTALHVAARFDNTVGARLLLDRKANPDLRDGTGATPLKTAVAFGRLEVARLLLSARANPNLPDKNGVTPLMAAAQGPASFGMPLGRVSLPRAKPTVDELKEIRELLHLSINLVQLLLEHKADPTIRDATGQPLWNYGRANITRLEGEQSVLDVLSKAGLKAPPPDVATAIQFDDLGELKAALAAGGDPNVKVAAGIPAVVYTAQDPGATEFLRALLESKANPNVRDTNDLTPLMAAVRHSDLANLRLLLEKGAEPDFPGGGGYTPLAEAVLQKSKAAILTLLAKGAKLETRDVEGRSPLMFASNVEILELLLEKGADPRATDKSGMSVLMHLVAEDDTDDGALVARIINRGVDVNYQSRDGNSAIWLATTLGSEAILKRLLEKGANPNLSLPDGSSPLMLAAQDGNEAAVRLLLARKADPNLKTKSGLTALKLAVKRKHAGIVRLLKKVGAQL